MVTELRVNSERVGYSVMGGRVRLSTYSRWKIEEMDDSNGPESGRNLAAILDPQTASLCQFDSLAQLGFPLICLLVLVRYRLKRPLTLCCY